MLENNASKLIGVGYEKSFHDLYAHLDFNKKQARFLELDNATYTGKLPKWFEQYKGKNLTINYSEDNSQISLLSVRSIILAKAPNISNEVTILPILPNIKNIRIINGSYQFDTIPDKLDYLCIENATCNIDLATFNVKTVSIVISEIYASDYDLFQLFRKAIANPNVKKVYFTLGNFPDLGPSSMVEILFHGSKINITAKSYPEWFLKMASNRIKTLKIRYA